MCLTKQCVIRQNKYGYKWAIKCEGEYYSINTFHNYPSSGVFRYGKIGQEIEAEKSRIVDAEWGFHIFNNLNEAKESTWQNVTIYPENTPAYERVLLKVTYSCVRFTGIGDGLTRHRYEIIVAQKMTLIEEVKL